MEGGEDEPVLACVCRRLRPLDGASRHERCSAGEMTLDDIVQLSGETAETVRHWQELGLVPGGDEFGAEELERIGLVRFAARRGVSPDEMARYCEQHGDWLE